MLAPVPAQAAEGQHCVVPIPDPDRLACFGTIEEALEFATGGQGTTPSKETGTAAATTGRVGVQALVGGQVAVATWYDGFFFTGASLTWVGFNGNCTTSTGNIDYQASSVPASWNNRMSSFITYANCWEDDFDLPAFGGYHTGYRGTQAIVNATINNDTSSVRWS
jgi:hypothetical protein